MVNYTIIVSGKVQGVFYRATARDVARQLGLTGIVRNESSGDVYIEAQGEREALDKLVEWCKIGPRNARVTNLDVKEGKPKSYADFCIIKS